MSIADQAEKAKAVQAELLAQADGLDILAEECEAIAAHFYPRYRALWGRDGTGPDDMSQIRRLYPFAVTRTAEGQRMRAEAKALRDAVTLLQGGEL